MTPTETTEAVSCHDVAAVWSGTPAGLALHTEGDRQFVAFYDAERTMTVGSRRLGETDWTFERLPEERRVEWDAHNYLALAVDEEGHVHLSGNMHNDPLTYVRTTDPLDVTTVKPIHEMVGSEEDSVTYPQFLREPADELVFSYRDGHSGGGNWIYDVYDPANREWARLFDQPITYGGDEMNAYPADRSPGRTGNTTLAGCGGTRATPPPTTTSPTPAVRTCASGKQARASRWSFPSRSRRRRSSTRFPPVME